MGILDAAFTAPGFRGWLALDAWPTAEIYAKVLAEAPVDGGFAVRFTAVPGEAKRLLRAASA